MSTPQSRGASAVFLSAVPLLVGCNDFTTGQDPEPPALEVKRLTLFDGASRDAPVFTDTSVPDCSKAENQAPPGVASDINRDKYGPIKSPPTPDSGREIRVVLNKLPAYLGPKDLEVVQPGKDPVAEQGAAKLICEGCSGLPPITLSLY